MSDTPESEWEPVPFPDLEEELGPRSINKIVEKYVRPTLYIAPGPVTLTLSDDAFAYVPDKQPRIPKTLHSLYAQVEPHAPAGQELPLTPNADGSFSAEIVFEEL